MGVSEIYLYGRTMDNESGKNYFARIKFVGSTNQMQKDCFHILRETIQHAGVVVRKF